MTRSRTTILLGASLVLALASGAASAQTATTGQFGQRVGTTYLPSTHDANCVGLLCSPLPAAHSANPAASPSEVAAPPPCQGLLCSLTPYSMQRPYTAAQAAEVERQRVAAQAQIAAAPSPPATPVRPLRKRRKLAKVARAAPADRAAARAPSPSPRMPAPADDIQTLR